MKRRTFIVGLGSAAAWPLAARAQQPAVPVIGYLASGTAELNYKNFTAPFLKGLKESGYVHPRQPGRLPQAAEIAQLCGRPAPHSIDRPLS